LVSADPNLVERAKWLSTQAKEHTPYYHHTTLGYNYRLSNISAGIGRGQLEVLDERVQQRRAVFQNYQSLLQDLEEIEWLQEPEGFFSNRWLSCITLKKGCPLTPEQLRLKLIEAHIEARPLWQPMHRQPLYQGVSYFGGGVADDLFTRGLCLPSGSSLTLADQERVADVIKKAFQKQD
ncbi:DegT/DnrJ/EryC1/StrS family aminotransferase, partial [Amycolatopsis magusensis]